MKITLHATKPSFVSLDISSNNRLRRHVAQEKVALCNLGSPNNIRCEAAPAPNTTL